MIKLAVLKKLVAMVDHVEQFLLRVPNILDSKYKAHIGGDEKGE